MPTPEINGSVVTLSDSSWTDCTIEGFGRDRNLVYGLGIG